MCSWHDFHRRRRRGPAKPFSCLPGKGRRARMCGKCKRPLTAQRNPVLVRHVLLVRWNNVLGLIISVLLQGWISIRSPPNLQVSSAYVDTARYFQEKLPRTEIRPKECNPVQVRLNNYWLIITKRASCVSDACQMQGVNFHENLPKRI